MATIKRFEDLECWQQARKFAKMIYGLTKGKEFRKDLRLVSQACGSAVSSMANIAEGFHRNSTRDFIKFLDYSRASIAETISHCYVAFDQAYIGQSELEMVKDQGDLVWKKVNSLITYLNNASKSGEKSNKLNQLNKSNKPN